VTNYGYYTSACDVWSLGILLYRMLFGREPFSSYEEAANAGVELKFPDHAMDLVGTEAIDLVQWMLQRDPIARPSVPQVRKRAFGNDEGCSYHSWRCSPPS
jgi:serine/threonine protein kinase